MQNNNPTPSRLVQRAQALGSASRTPSGALRFLRRRLHAVQPAPLPTGDGSTLHYLARSRDEWERERLERRAERICNALGLPVRPDPVEKAGLLATLTADDLEEACYRGQGLDLGPYHISADRAVQEILRRIGPAGEQALADEARYLEEYDVVQYASRRHRGRDWRQISLARVASDASAAILSYIEAGSYLHCADRRGGLHHLRVSAYLVVRDATTGERHLLRVPPRFGTFRSATYRRARSSDELIHAAAAWTFGLRPEEYHPEIAA